MKQSKRKVIVQRKEYELLGEYDEPVPVGETIAGTHPTRDVPCGVKMWTVLGYDEEADTYTVLTDKQTKTKLVITGGYSESTNI